MKKILLIADPHVNFLTESDQKTRDVNFIGSFCKSAKDSQIDSCIITGDISEYPTLKSDLELLEKHLDIPIFWINGNHDFYHGSFEKVINLSKEITTSSNHLKWLGCIDVPVGLTEKSCLVGDDGFYDCLAGFAENSRLQMTDFMAIEDFRFQAHGAVVAMARKRAFESAERVRSLVEKAVQSHEIIYVATHVPPFHEASRAPDGTISNGHWAAFMVHDLLGKTLIELAEKYKNKSFISVSGHTHTFCEYHPKSNLTVIVGKADYGNIFGKILEIE